MIELTDVVAGYSRTPVLHGVDIAVEPGMVVAVLGANGAGKSTLVRVAAGLVPVMRGSVRWAGRSVEKLPAFKRARLGLAAISEQKDLFPDLSIADHLELGNRLAALAHRKGAIERVHDLFPVLGERPNAVSASLSGGQQQMLAIGRALAGAPRCLILDEPSLGLAPQVTAEILRAVRRLADDGLAVVLVEQNARQALRVADAALVLRRGRVAQAGSAAELAESSALGSLYLGGA